MVCAPNPWGHKHARSERDAAVPRIQIPAYAGMTAVGSGNNVGVL